MFMQTTNPTLLSWQAVPNLRTCRCGNGYVHMCVHVHARSNTKISLFCTNIYPYGNGHGAGQATIGSFRSVRSRWHMFWVVDLLRGASQNILKDSLQRKSYTITSDETCPGQDDQQHCLWGNLHHLQKNTDLQSVKMNGATWLVESVYEPNM